MSSPGGVGARIPPHNRDAEESLLGSMMLTNSAVLAALDHVTAADFYIPIHRQIFEAIDQLYAAGQGTDARGIDPVTVAARIPVEGIRSLLLKIQADTPASANAAHYASIVAQCARARRAIAHGDALADAGWENDGDAIDKLAASTEGELRAALASVATWDLNDLVALADQDDQNPVKPWVIPGLMRTQEAIVITGAEGFGKATLMRQIGIALASGVHPFTGLAAEMTPRPVTYIDLQETEIDMAHETRTIRRQMNVQYEPGWYRAVSRKQGMDLLVPRDRRWFESIIHDTQPSLVLIGPLVRMYRGDDRRGRYDEGVVDDVTNFLDEMMVRYDFSVIIEAHAGNERSTAEDWRPRGSAVWRSWPAFGFGMKPLNYAPREAEVVRWRTGRYAGRPWPTKLYQGNRLPWEPSETDYERMVRAMGLGWLIDGQQQQEIF